MVKFLQIVLVLIFLYTSLFSQSDSLNIFWSPNPEPDMQKYLLQRSVNSLTDFTDYFFIAHPDTHAVDHDIGPGNLYAYRLAAIDSAGNQSPFSETVSAGIPKILIQNLNISSSQSFAIDLINIATDPDDSISELSIEIMNENHLLVTRNSGMLNISPDPLDYIGTANFDLKVTDPLGFWDMKTIMVNVEDVVFIVECPDLFFPEDEYALVNLDSCFFDPNTSADAVHWDVSQAMFLNLEYNPNNRLLKISSKESDWYGIDFFVLTGQNSQQLTRSDTVRVEIQPVNDTPVLSIATIYLNTQQSQWIVDMDSYVSDVDDPLNTLNFEFLGFQNFQFSFIAPGTHEVEITRVGSASVETGQVRVTDPGGLFDEASVTLQVIDKNTPPHIVGLSSIIAAEDSIVTLNLNQFVQDSTDNPQDMIWEIESNNLVQVDYDSTKNRAQFIPQKDWFGLTTLEFRVIDRLGASDERIIPVRVEPRIDLFNFRAMETGLDQGTVSWQTDMPSICVFEYWLNPFQKNSISASYTPQTFHEVELRAIISDTLYHFRITAQDTSRRFTVLVDSIFSFGRSVLAFDHVVVYPNPVKTGEGQELIYFENLPQNTANLTLYNILGEEVFSTDLDEVPDGRFTLPVVKDDHLKLGSGYYIYLIKSTKNEIIKRGIIVLIN